MTPKITPLPFHLEESDKLIDESQNVKSV